MRRVETIRVETIRSVDRTDEIYRALLRGSHVFADRATGKTTAILKAAHEMGADHCIVVVADDRLRIVAEYRWAGLYPGEQAPRIMCGYNRALRSVDRRTVIIVDEYRQAQYEGEYHSATDSN